MEPSTSTLPTASGSRPLYQESSQYRHWRFSALQLERMRRELNLKAVEVVKSNMESEAVSLFVACHYETFRVLLTLSIS